MGLTPQQQEDIQGKAWKAPFVPQDRHREDRELLAWIAEANAAAGIVVSEIPAEQDKSEGGEK